MLCTNCDTRNDNNALVCRACGTALTAPATSTTGSTPRSAYTFIDPGQTAPACPACTRTNPAGARYCVYCATPLNGAATYVAAGALQPAFVGGGVMQPQASFTLTFGAPGPLLLRAMWFVFVGWWLGLIWTMFAWLFNLTLIGLPVGVMMLNFIPQVMTLRTRNKLRVQVTPNGNVFVHQPVEQALPLRAMWFVFIGWWASLVWMLAAWAFSASIVLMPIAFWMFDRVPTITTLAAE